MRGGGFEPPKALSQQILSLSRLTAPASPQKDLFEGILRTSVCYIPAVNDNKFCKQHLLNLRLSDFISASVAQPGLERRPPKAEVVGSNPIGSVN